ncbi:MAG: Ku protein [Actinomycetota bacterium]|nr:Ku protein [Actinomycetota bacterium]
MRSVWSGTLSFGLVVIPVKLYPATEPKDVRFHLVDPETGRRIRYKRVVDLDDGREREDAIGGREREHAAGGDGGRTRTVPPPAAGDEQHDVEVEVPYEGLARGYEVAPGEQVMLTQDEIRSVRPERSRTIEIEDFVDLASIDPVYFEKSYLLAPRSDGLAERPYALLLHALERSSRVGIGRFVLRTKPHLVAIRSNRGVLSLETLFFGDEVREPSKAVPTGSVAIGDRELEMAQQLIDMLATEWDPARYADTYREELLRLIADKAPEPAPIPEGSRSDASRSDVERLMDALKESVQQEKRKAAGPQRSREAKGA